ncbi:hypothetical protein [Peredibacter starrii]|uniref:DUF4878 domain-containing protein n=1 Tax=Peredibacter starrii TaxID=28202 RepID=A0AAX4HQE2_9BACT|nr:hypothetical protein [Peredibacter starrii]WPU65328.1 hypothetical protein SOO65_01045 [Peredibacter starrii]
MKWILPVLLILAACNQDNLSPESALKSYMDGRMGTIVTRDFILERVTGKMKQSFENMDDEEFKKASDMTNIKKESFKILSKSCQEKKCFLTYSVAYQTKAEEKTTFATEVKKIAEVVNEGGKWLISDVSNIKTYHEALEPINPLE